LIATVTGQLLSRWFGIDGGQYYWYYGVGLLIILIPMCYLRKISAFTQMHVIGDIAVLSTVIALLANSIGIIVDMPSFNLNDYKMIDSGWSKILGMAVSTLEGVGVILPIKENMKDKSQFNKIVYIGMIIVVIIVIGFPLTAYFSYKDRTPEVFYK
jgi:proton-coupled amino acid transporter